MEVVIFLIGLGLFALMAYGFVVIVLAAATSKKPSEKKLAEREARFDATFDGSPQVTYGVAYSLTPEAEIIEAASQRGYRLAQTIAGSGGRTTSLVFEKVPDAG